MCISPCAPADSQYAFKYVYASRGFSGSPAVKAASAAGDTGSSRGLQLSSCVLCGRAKKPKPPWTWKSKLKKSGIEALKPSGWSLMIARRPQALSLYVCLSECVSVSFCLSRPPSASGRVSALSLRSVLPAPSFWLSLSRALSSVPSSLPPLRARPSDGTLLPWLSVLQSACVFMLFSLAASFI